MSMRSITTWTFKDEEPLTFAQKFKDLEGTTLLYSGGTLDSAQNSFLCLFPEEKIEISAKKMAWDDLKKILGSFFEPSFLPKWVGFVGYEMGAFSDPDFSFSLFERKLPDALFYRPSTIIHFNHLSKKATLYGQKLLSIEKEGPFKEGHPKSKLLWASDTQESYLEKISQLKEWILDGEVYQVNLSQEFHFESQIDPFFLFKKIATLNPAPFSAFLNAGSFCVVSSSPERFLKKEKNALETRPIKGTAPRSKEKADDKKNKERLLSSEKEKAELLMITDLMRNDLGKVSKPGSIEVKDLWRLEAYENVFHLLSIIQSEALPLHPVDLMRPLFPGGSITGCPKLSAMEKISLLEKRARGLYTGSIGYFAENGDFDFNIAIRTLIVHPEHIQMQVGGAIVSDSEPLSEFEETLHKGKSLFRVLGVEGL